MGWQVKICYALSEESILTFSARCSSWKLQSLPTRHTAAIRTLLLQSHRRHHHRLHQVASSERNCMRFLRLLNHFLTFGQAPDPRARDRMEQLLRERLPLMITEWADLLAPSDCNEEATAFVFGFFWTSYGIDMARSRPGDSLANDLCFPRSLWNDWELDFAEAFERKFNVNLFATRSLMGASTAGEMVAILARELAGLNNGSCVR